MASAETKVVVLALLILAVGFIYTNVRDKVTGYALVKDTTDLGGYAFQTDESDYLLIDEQPTVSAKEQLKKEVSLQEVFKDVQQVNSCSADIPLQIRQIVGVYC